LCPVIAAISGGVHPASASRTTSDLERGIEHCRLADQWLRHFQTLTRKVKTGVWCGGPDPLLWRSLWPLGQRKLARNWQRWKNN